MIETLALLTTAARKWQAPTAQAATGTSWARPLPPCALLQAPLPLSMGETLAPTPPVRQRQLPPHAAPSPARLPPPNQCRAYPSIPTVKCDSTPLLRGGKGTRVGMRDASTVQTNARE